MLHTALNSENCVKQACFAGTFTGLGEYNSVSFIKGAIDYERSVTSN